MPRCLPALLAGLILEAAGTPARAIDPPAGQGYLQYGKERHELRHVHAVRSPDNPKRIWILLTSAEIAAKDAADPARVLKLATSGKLRGARLSVDSAAPNPGHIQGALLLSKEEAPAGEIVFAAGQRKYWEQLKVGDNHIVGKVRHDVEATASGSPAWTLEATFSAPVFNAR